MRNRATRILLAQETFKILDQGYYQIGGQQYDIAEAQHRAVQESKAWLPEELDAILAEQQALKGTFDTQFEVHNETTLNAAQRLSRNEEAVCILNFASARNPGGGVKTGSQAQEESIARASGLFPCIAQMEDHYAYHKKHRSGLYTDRMIYSPEVPVFRDDADQLIVDWYTTSVITSAAVNLGSLKQNRPDQIPQTPAVMRIRAAKVLALAAHHQQEQLVLGAWGCGVFQQEPQDMATYFAELLFGDGAFAGRFKRVVFAVLDRKESGKFIQPFAERFF